MSASRRRGLAAQQASRPAAASMTSGSKRARSISSLCRRAGPDSSPPNQNCMRSASRGALSGRLPNQNRRSSPARSVTGASSPCGCWLTSTCARPPTSTRGSQPTPTRGHPADAKATRAARPASLAQALEISLRDGREALARELAGLRRIDDVLERPRNQHLPDARALRGGARHLVEDGEAAVDLARRSAVLLDRPREILSEASEKEVIVIADLEARFGEEVGEVLREIVGNSLKTGSRVAVSRRFALLHRCSS